MSNKVNGLMVGSNNNTSLMEKFVLSSTGNATTFGTLTPGRHSSGATGNATRGLVMGGMSTSSINYITFSTNSNSTNFGTITQNGNRNGACSNNQIAIVAGGNANTHCLIEYVTIAILSNAATFGKLSVYNGRECPGCSSNYTDGFICSGGYSLNPITNVIDKITFSTLGDASNWGNLLTGRGYLGAVSSFIKF